ncbi:MAG TPA: hypothetical protein VEI50_15280 [Nitrospiraceae bacterium]|nr:hypothetical protein [Nitrospiraceae bacterium]
MIVHPNLRTPHRIQSQRTLFNLSLVLMFLMLSGCHYYEEYRVLKSTADIQDEKAELLRAYRLCLEKYQDDPPKAKELCGPYTQALREIEVKQSHQR